MRTLSALLAVPALFPETSAVGLTAAVAAGLASGRGSVPEVRQILEQVRASAEDAQHRTEKAGAEAEASCLQALRSSDEHAAVANLVRTRLQSDLEEQQAAVDEATGNTQQVRSNIDLVEHTLAQIEKNPRLGSVLSENKRRTLQSLRGELRIMLPAFAQLQARAAEAGRRLDDHVRSWDSAASLWKAVRQVCTESSERGTELSSRSSEQRSSMDEVLKALKPLDGAAPQHSEPAAAAEPEAAEPEPQRQQATEDAADDDDGPSFVQLARRSAAADADEDDDGSSDQDLMSLLGSGGSAVSASPVTTAAAAAAGGAAATVARAEAPDVGSGSFLDLMPKVKQLLAEVKSVGRSAAGAENFCKQDRVDAQLSLRAVTAAAKELGAEAGAHDEAAAQAGEDLARINGTVVLIQDVMHRISASISAERQVASDAAKDERLAAKILSQAGAVLAETISARGPEGEAAVTAVQAAATAFAPSRSSAAALLQLRDLLVSTQRLANASLLEFGREVSHLEFARDSHVALRERTLESKRLYDSQLSSSHEYLQKLEQRCGAGAVAASASDRERTVEIRALSDAQDALAGKALHGEAAAQPETPALALRGAASGSAAGNVAAASQRSLSPLERAAAEMGVAVDAA